MTFTATSNPAGWTFSTDINVSVHPKNFVKNEIGRMDLKVRLVQLFSREHTTLKVTLSVHPLVSQLVPLLHFVDIASQKATCIRPSFLSKAVLWSFLTCSNWNKKVQKKAINHRIHKSLRVSAGRPICPSARPSVALSFWGFSGQITSYVLESLTLSSGSAHQHATGTVVYTALFLSFNP